MSKIPGVEDRARLLSCLREELVGPSTFTDKANEVSIIGSKIEVDENAGPIFLRNQATNCREEVLYERNEGPSRRYGVGVLHPDWSHQAPDVADELEDQGFDNSVGSDDDAAESEQESGDQAVSKYDGEIDNDPEVSRGNRYKQSSMGISFCAELQPGAFVRVVVPHETSFDWQPQDDSPIRVNGLYRSVVVARKQKDKDEAWEHRGAWRTNAFPPGTQVDFSAEDIAAKRYLKKGVPVVEGSPQKFDVVLRARHLSEGRWLITVTLRNLTQTQDPKRSQFMLFQSFFEVELVDPAKFRPYPDPPQDPLGDSERESLKLLYRNSKTWAIGHNCAAGWRQNGEQITSVFCDVFPVYETPSMTPDIVDRDGKELRFSMKELAELDDSGTSASWQKLDRIEAEYRHWIGERGKELGDLGANLEAVGRKHLEACESVCDRIKAGITILKSETSPNARLAFRLANKSMMMQQIGTKVLKRRELVFNSKFGVRGEVVPSGDYETPFKRYEDGDLPSHIGNWRAFQLAFLLMNIPDFTERDPVKLEKLRENVELIWFPTGGGKTEAYLGVAAFAMFLARLDQGDEEAEGREFLPADGTNIFMRYTLRMLTTQQFQRAAALICAMECLRLNFPEKRIAGERFSLGLWIGSSSTPNNNETASAQISRYRNKHNSQKNNPLVLTECPWCRAEIGRADISKPNKKWSDKDWKNEALCGVVSAPEPHLCCSDSRCAFSSRSKLKRIPVVVIDEQIYDSPPSLVIATADKFAVIPYRPNARAIFGLDRQGQQVRRSPSLIIQDETHLISGPLGTMYGLYESVIEVLATDRSNGANSKPKIICSTATIRGVEEQLRSIFARGSFTLFPPPGIDISDSFFGCYAKEKGEEKLKPGRMYCGIHATGFVSAQTTQVRLYSTLLVNVENRIEESRRDPWWTILCFYNSLRELGGARTLFQGDIKSRMKFLTRRDKFSFRKDPHLEELSSRLKQDEIVAMLDHLNVPFPNGQRSPLDVCLASNIIEVGVDIDRLSLMAVIGQPKNTAQYIQVTGRVGRRWHERPGLVCTVYSGTKIRDKSHFEQFYSYHSRLYEEVEPTVATPFSRASLDRGVIGAMLLYARCVRPHTRTARFNDYESALLEAKTILIKRCQAVEKEKAAAQVSIIEENYDVLRTTWDVERDDWERFTLSSGDSVLLRWPGQFADAGQQNRTIEIPSSLRQVDQTGELVITKHYLVGDE